MSVGGRLSEGLSGWRCSAGDFNYRCDPDSAQRLPSQETEADLKMGRYTGPKCRRNGGGFKDGEIHRSKMSALPTRGGQTFSEGGSL